VKVACSRLPAIACALILPLCALAIWPVVEMGVNDEWSYVKTVQILSQTGHVVYNGWATAMVGWQLYLGAIFVKLFGFSFTAVRLSILVVAMAIAFLTQRILVRIGIHQWNATLGTLVLILSPLFLPLAFSFMTDVPGLFVIVLCLYACLRALQAETGRAALAWICFAAISNATGGTVRQIAWLGVLVMVPSTLWLLRRRPYFLLAGGILYVSCVAFIFGFLHWFHQQFYSVPESLFPHHMGRHAFVNLIRNAFLAVLDTPLLLLPVFLLFIPALPRNDRRANILVITGGSLCLLFLLFELHRHMLFYWLAPFLGNYVTIYGVMDDLAMHSPGPIILGFGVRLFITALLFASLLSLFALLLVSKRGSSPDSDLDPQISWYHLGVLLGPFTFAYIVLLLPRATGTLFFDRYLLPILLVVIILVLRCYQERVRPLIPRVAIIPIAIVALFSIAGTHDSFALFRARLVAINELRAAGVPPTAIDGGFEYNGWNQIETTHFINDPQIHAHAEDHFRPSVHESFGVCPPLLFDDFSVVSPRYAMAYDPTACLGQASFAPVTCRSWLAPHSTTIYVVKVGQPTNQANH
jgi:hypothetical protein